LLAIVLLAGTLRWMHVESYADSALVSPRLPIIDSRYYDQQARSIAQGDLIGDHIFYMAPLYQYSLAVPYEIADLAGRFSERVRWSRYLQALFGAVTVGLIGWIAWRSSGLLAALIAAALAAGYGPFVFYDGILMPSSQILTVNLAALAALLEAARSRGTAWWAVFGLVATLAVLAHGTALLFLAAALAWLMLQRRWSLRGRLARVACVLAVLVPVVATVAARNAHVGNELVPLTSNVGRNFYIGNNPTATGTFRMYPSEIPGAALGDYMRGFSHDAAGPPVSEASRSFLRRAARYVVANPIEAAGLVLKKLRLLLTFREFGVNDNYYFAQEFSPVLRWPLAGMGLVGPLGLAGAVAAWRRRRRAGLVHLMAASQAAAFLATFVLGRYRLTLAACLILFCGHLVAYLVDRWRRRTARGWLSPAAALAISAVLVFWPVPGFGEQRGFGQLHVHTGKNHVLRGDDRAAAREFRGALTADFSPWKHWDRRRAEAALRLGAARERLGRLEEARQAYRMALRWVRDEAGGDDAAARLAKAARARLRRLGARGTERP
jgi:4-amino-4-deoxy-L-arabinose transferase-like glycosyltransferase